MLEVLVGVLSVVFAPRVVAHMVLDRDRVPLRPLFKKVMNGWSTFA